MVQERKCLYEPPWCRNDVFSPSEWAPSFNFTTIRANLSCGELKNKGMQKSGSGNSYSSAVDRILLEWREAGWITQCSTRFDSSAILTLAGRCARITWQYAGRRQTYSIFSGCRDQKQTDRFSRMKGQVFSFSSVLWNLHPSEVQLPQSVCCPEQNTGRAIRGNPQQPHRRETASRMKLQFHQRPLPKNALLVVPSNVLINKWIALSCRAERGECNAGVKAVGSSTYIKHKKN